MQRIQHHSPVIKKGISSSLPPGRRSISYQGVSLQINKMNITYTKNHLSWTILVVFLIAFLPVRAISQNSVRPSISDIIQAHQQRREILNAVFTFEYNNSWILPLPGGKETGNAAEAVLGEFYIFQSIQNNVDPANQMPIFVYDGTHTHLLSNVSLNASTGRLDGGQGQQRDTAVDGKKNSLYGPAEFGFKIEGDWICDVLQPSFKMVSISDDIENGKLYEYLGQYRNTPLRLIFAPKYNYACIKAEWKSSATRTIIFEAANFINDRGLWFAQTGSMRTIDTQKNGVKLPAGQSVIFSDYQINNARLTLANQLSEATFQVRLAKGSQVFDQDRRTVYKVGENNEKFEDKEMVRLMKLNRLPMAIGWLFIGSMTTLLLLGLAAFIRWRRRDSS